MERLVINNAEDITTAETVSGNVGIFRGLKL